MQKRKPIVLYIYNKGTFDDFKTFTTFSKSKFHKKNEVHFTEQMKMGKTSGIFIYL